MIDHNKIPSIPTSMQSITNKLDQEIRSLRKDMQNTVKSDGGMIPSMATKVAINADGLVVGTYSLTPDDIPKIPQNKVEGLEETLEKLQDSVITKTVVNEVPVPMDIKLPPIGVNDLPKIPMSKVEGLTEALVMIETGAGNTSDSVSDPIPLPPIEVIKYKDITMENLPRELINQVNSIETSLVSLATKESLDGFRKELSSKLEKNAPIEDGTFGVVTVDRKGLVIRGRPIAVGDLPDEFVNSIYGIKKELIKKAEHEDVVSLMNQLNLFVNTISQLDLGNVKTSLATKCSKEELNEVCNDVDSLRRRLDNMDAPVMKPDENVLREIQELRSQISSLAGTMAVLQQKVTLLSAPSSN